MRKESRQMSAEWAQEGKKLDALSKNPRVCLNAVTKCKRKQYDRNGEEMKWGRME